MFLVALDSTGAIPLDDIKTIAFIDELFNRKPGMITLAFTKINLLDDPIRYKKLVEKTLLPKIN